jgi:phage-related protein
MISFEIPAVPDPVSLAASLSTMSTSADTAISDATAQIDTVANMTIDNCDLFGTIGSLASQASSAVQGSIAGAVSDIRGVTNRLMQGVGSVIKSVKGFVSQAISAIGGLISKFAQLGTELFATAMQKVQALIGSLNSVFDSIRGAVSSAVNMIGSMMSGLGNSIRGMLAFKCDNTKGVLGSMSAIGSGISDNVDRLISTANLPTDLAMDSVIGGLSDTLSGVTDQIGSVDSLMDTANTAISGLGSQIDEIVAFA